MLISFNLDMHSFFCSHARGVLFVGDVCLNVCLRVVCAVSKLSRHVVLMRLLVLLLFTLLQCVCQPQTSTLKRRNPSGSSK